MLQLRDSISYIGLDTVLTVIVLTSAKSCHTTNVLTASWH